jgi:ketosteroid isomerase-like protein
LVKSHLEMVRAFTAAFNAHEVEALVACCNPDVEFHSTFAAVGGAVYYGQDGMHSWHRDLEEAWENEIRSELEASYDLGDGRLLTFGVLYGRGKQSGAEATMPIAAVTRLRDGLLVYYKAYVDRENALRELGVSSEDGLEPITP